jgi:hypothetical protein
MHKKVLFLFIALAVAAAALGAQNLVKPTATMPSVDGKIATDEYSLFGSVGGMNIGASLSADGKTLSLAIQAPTSGWVAIGLGSSYMDGAYIVMGYEAGGKAAVSEQIGSGHSHSPAKGSKVLKSAVHSVNGTTVLEFQVKAADFVKGGKLPLIMAYGKNADFVTRHLRFASTELSF